MIQLLPTYPPCIEELQSALESEVAEAGSQGDADMQLRWKSLFDSSNLHCFLYSMQCLEMLAQKSEKVSDWFPPGYPFVLEKTSLSVRGIGRPEAFGQCFSG